MHDLATRLSITSSNTTIGVARFFRKTSKHGGFDSSCCPRLFNRSANSDGKASMREIVAEREIVD
jgi:hypothetical protein